jgi:hypothetical protein
MEKSKIENLNPLEYTHLPHAEQHFEDHEQSDVAIPPLVASLIAIALTVLISAVGLWGLFELFEYMARNAADNQNLSKVEPSIRHVPVEYPELQGVPAAEANPNSPAQDMTIFRADNDQILTGQKPMRPGLKPGMSIDKAMDEALARGIFKTAPATQPTQPAERSASGR